MQFYTSTIQLKVFLSLRCGKSKLFEGVADIRTLCRFDKSPLLNRVPCNSNTVPLSDLFTSIAARRGSWLRQRCRVSSVRVL